MSSAHIPITREAWLANLFSSNAARSGQTVRRKLSDVIQYVGLDFFVSEVERRGYSAVLNGEQVVIFCNAEPIKRLV
ncbi:MAG: N-(5'-phosphoribosyl)anthranilate isomerase [Shimia sp.]